jgi:hypothetical protein
MRCASKQEHQSGHSSQLCPCCLPPRFPSPSPPHRSIEGKSKHQLWLELCDLITKHPKDVLGQGIHVDAILRGGIRRYTDEVGGSGW